MDPVNISSFTVFDPDAVRHDSLLVGGARPSSGGPSAPLEDATFELGQLVAYLQARSTVGGAVYLAPSEPETYSPVDHPDWDNVRRVSVLANTENAPLTIRFPEEPRPGDVVNLISYGDHFDKNPVLLDPGVEIINGQTTPVSVNLPGINLTAFYVSAEVGWALLQKGDVLVVNTAVNGYANAPKLTVTNPQAQIPPNFQNGVLILGPELAGEEVEITLPNSAYLASPWGFKIVSQAQLLSLQFLAANGEDVIGRFGDGDTVDPGLVGDVCYIGNQVFSTPS